MKKEKKQTKATKKIKNKTVLTEEQSELVHFAIIVVVIFVLVGVIYGVSRIFIKEETKISSPESQVGNVNYDVVSIGTMFNRNYDEYYVFIYDIEDPNGVYYSAIVNSYKGTKDALKVYFCDLGNTLNKDYIAKDKSNPKAKTMKDLSLGKLTLVKIKNGKITKYLENIDDIKKELS